MKRAEVYQCDNGQLEHDLDRAKANDLSYAIGRAIKEADGAARDTRVDWHVAMELLRHADIVKKHVDEFIELRDAAPPKQKHRFGEASNELFEP